MLPDRVSNPGPPTYESDALPIALRGLAACICTKFHNRQGNYYTASADFVWRGPDQKEINLAIYRKSP